jgi:hypothetical protein
LPSAGGDGGGERNKQPLSRLSYQGCRHSGGSFSLTPALFAPRPGFLAGSRSDKKSPRQDGPHETVLASSSVPPSAVSCACGTRLAPSRATRRNAHYAEPTGDRVGAGRRRLKSLPRKRKKQTMFVLAPRYMLQVALPRILVDPAWPCMAALRRKTALSAIGCRHPDRLPDGLQLRPRKSLL